MKLIDIAFYSAQMNYDPSTRPFVVNEVLPDEVIGKLKTVIADAQGTFDRSTINAVQAKDLLGAALSDLDISLLRHGHAEPALAPHLSMGEVFTFKMTIQEDHPLPGHEAMHTVLRGYVSERPGEQEYARYHITSITKVVINRDGNANVIDMTLLSAHDKYNQYLLRTCDVIQPKAESDSVVGIKVSQCTTKGQTEQRLLNLLNVHSESFLTRLAQMTTWRPNITANSVLQRMRVDKDDTPFNVFYERTLRYNFTSNFPKAKRIKIHPQPTVEGKAADPEHDVDATNLYQYFMGLASYLLERQVAFVHYHPDRGVMASKTLLETPVSGEIIDTLTKMLFTYTEVCFNLEGMSYIRMTSSNKCYEYPTFILGTISPVNTMDYDNYQQHQRQYYSLSQRGQQ